VTRAVFKVFAENERLATLFSRHMYEHHLPDAIKAIAPLCKAEAVALAADLLDQAVRISGKVTDDPPHDYTYYLSSEVSAAIRRRSSFGSPCMCCRLIRAVCPTWRKAG
jgi:hypothetical protein